MAVVKMKKLSLIGLERERAKILNAFSSLSSVELKEVRDIGLAKHTADDGYRNALAVKMNGLNDCLESFEYFLREKQALGKGAKKEKNPLKGTPEFKLEELIHAHEREYRLLLEADNCKNVRRRISEIDAQTADIAHEELDKLKAERADLINEGAALADYADEIKLLYDYYNMEHQKEGGNEYICKTDKTFFLEAWLPADKEAEVRGAIESTLTVSAIEFSKPAADEEPPVIVKSNKLADPYNAITNMYGKPNYREKDPSTVLGIFYFIFFGMLLGDVGYGLIITLGSLFLILKMKPQGDFARLLKVFLIGGISSMIWGVLYGSWFMAQTTVPFMQPLLFDPLDSKNFMDMIAISLGFGMLHICAGFGMRAYNKISKGKIIDAILDDFTWIGAFVGVGLAVAGMGVVSFVPENSSLLNIGWITAIGCLALLVVTGGRHSKKFFGKAFGGMGNLYKVINLFSDVLSYLRLFGLALAGGILGQVFNMLGGMVMGGGVLGYIGGGLILAIGHALNIAVGILGIYIHNSRLQFIEFFSKFYGGEGEAFKPFAGETKYIKVLRD